MRRRAIRARGVAPPDPHRAALARIATAIGKFWICKRAPGVVNEAQECLGGAGYVEESILARLYREAPLNSIWEGCGNIQCLDVLRALRRDPETAAALLAELDAARGSNATYDSQVADLPGLLQDIDEASARRQVERIALLLQASVLLRGGDADVATAFCRARLAQRGAVYGSLPAEVPVERLLQRAWPVLA
jgi:putative acyl-CoA dehydrogenase